jgi:hypothetical protein
MKNLFDKAEYALSDIQFLIDTKAEEGLYIEFKSSGAFNKNRPENRNEIGKDISAFANSDGGIIIYGLAEDSNRQASEITYIDSTKFSADWLQQVIQSNIKRTVPDILIYNIQNPLKSTEQIYLVKITASPNSPHMAMDNKYYRRNNAGNVIMEEYEVRGLYNQNTKTNLEIVDMEKCGTIEPYTTGGGLAYIKCTVNFQIKNIGNTIEHNYKLEIHIPTILLNFDIRESHEFHKLLQRQHGKLNVYSIGNTLPIFQNEITRIVKLNLKITKENIHYLNSDIVLKLYYSSGTKEKIIKLNDLITYNSKQISSADFV